MNNEPLVSQLINLNFTPSEAKTYVALLEIGQTSAGEIIKKTRLHRSVVYDSLEKLINKKLVFSLKKHKISYFQPTNPHRIIEHAETQKKIAQNLAPALAKLVDLSQPEITVYEGTEAYKNFWIDSLKRMPVGAIDYVAGSIGKDWEKIMGKKNLDEYFKIARQRKISWKMIVFDKTDARQAFLNKYPQFKWQCRYIKSRVPKEGNFNLFDKESLILHSATEPMIIEIKNNSLIRVFKHLFDTLWQSGKKL